MLAAWSEGKQAGQRKKKRVRRRRARASGRWRAGRGQGKRGRGAVASAACSLGRAGMPSSTLLSAAVRATEAGSSMAFDGSAGLMRRRQQRRCQRPANARNGSLQWRLLPCGRSDAELACRFASGPAAVGVLVSMRAAQRRRLWPPSSPRAPRGHGGRIG